MTLPTFVFFHVGDDRNFPTLLVRSIKALHREAVIYQCTDMASPGIVGAQVFRIPGDTKKLMTFRLRAFAELGLSIPALYLDTDMLVRKPIDVAALLQGGDVSLCVRSFGRDTYIGTKIRGITIEEYEGKKLGEVYPYLACATACSSNQFWIDCVQNLQSLPEKFHIWYGDQEAIRNVANGAGYRLSYLPEHTYACLPDQPAVNDSEVVINHFKGSARKEVMIQYANRLNLISANEWLAPVSGDNFRQFALYSGLTIVAPAQESASISEVSPVDIIRHGAVRRMPALTLDSYSPTIARLDNAIVCGRRLSTIWNSMLLPTGDAHSLDWMQDGGFDPKLNPMLYRCADTEIKSLEESGPYAVLGIASRFGAFFTDCLDRILAFEQIELPGTTQYLVDGAPPPQIAELLTLLGSRITPSRFVTLDPACDYRASNLYVASPGSVEPAITESTFVALRERVMRNFPALKPKGNILYVGRKIVSRRIVVNQEAVDSAMRSLNVDSFYPELHSMADSIAAFNSAAAVVFVIGSSKFNIAFCRPGTKVICMAPKGYAENLGPISIMLRQMCKVLSLNLCFISCPVVGESFGVNSDIMIDPADIEVSFRMMGIRS